MLYVVIGAVEVEAVKFMPVREAPLMDTDAVEGENVYPDWLGVTTYEPFARPVNV
jgi:hypothetical protein